MSNVSTNGPAFLLRIRLESCASFIHWISNFYKFCAKHFFLVVGQSDMMEVETIHRSPIDMCRIVKTCEGCDCTFPFRNRVVQERLPAHQRNGGRDLLGRSCRLENQTDLFWNRFPVRLQLSHNPISSIDMKFEVILAL